MSKIQNKALTELRKIRSELNRASYGFKVGKKYKYVSLTEISELMNFYSSVSLEDFKKAKKILWDMDTTTRDTINSEIFNAVDDPEDYY